MVIVKRKNSLAIKALLLFIPLLIMFWISKLDIFLPNTNANVVRVKVAPEFNELDYLFIGASYTYDAINPRYFDQMSVKSFNLGVATAGPYFYDLLINDYLNSVSNAPKNILINISLLTFCDASDNWDKYPIHRYLNSPVSNENVFLKYAGFSSYVKMFRRSFFKGLNYLTFKTVPSDSSLKDSIVFYKGYSPQHIVCNDSVLKNDTPFYKKFYYYNDLDIEKTNKLTGIIEKLKQKKINVCLFEIPAYKGEKFFNEEFRLKYEQYKKKLRDENVKIIEADNDLMARLNNDCFANMDHMNVKGAAIYTNYLINKLGLTMKKITLK